MNKKNTEVMELLSELDPDIVAEMVVFEDLNEAIIGYAERAGMPIVALYDREKCIEILMKKEGVSRVKAEEYLDFNIVGAFVGQHTPVFATIINAR